MRIARYWTALAVVACFIIFSATIAFAADQEAAVEENADTPTVTDVHTVAKADAKKVSLKIKKLGKVTLKDKTKIQVARKEYNKLSTVARSYVKDYKTLKKAEKRYAKLYAGHVRYIKFRNGIARYIQKKNHRIGKAKARRYAKYFIQYGEKYKVDPAALVSIGYHESRFNATARNGAYMGMMQTSAAIGRFAGVSSGKLMNAKYSIKAAAKYFKYNLKYFHGNYRMAFAGYCAGTGGAARGNYNRAMVSQRMNVKKQVTKYVKKSR